MLAPAPGIEIEIVASSAMQDLRLREADIAIRHARPEHSDLIGKKIGETTAHLYAAKHYLDRVGRPEQPIDLVDYDFIGFETAERLLDLYNGFGIPLTRENFKVYSASGPVIVSLLKSGLGIGIATKDIEHQESELEMVLPELPAIEVPVWLVTHRELRTSPRIQLVFEVIATYLTERP
ncbi:MAG: LysR substrate-binding domain-containing protein [Pseudomonadota bacterium]